MNGASVLKQPEQNTGATCLAEGLFQGAGISATYMIIPDAGAPVRCEHCARTIMTVKGDCLVVTQRHDQAWHKSVIPLSQLGLTRAY